MASDGVEFDLKPLPPSTEAEWMELGYAARHVFKPRAPINDDALFAGRIPQIASLLEVIYETGAHAILYGERGVGKSSLANIIQKRILGPAKYANVLKVSCSPGDDFASIWSNVFYNYDWAGKPVANAIREQPQPFTIFKAAESLGTAKDFLVILDEFDRVTDVATKIKIADTIKYLSDNPVNFTIVIVGVGGSIGELFGSHPSIHRCCRQILMPRMSPPELSQVIYERVPLLNMTIDPNVVARMVQFSQGFPGYMHLLGQLAAIAATERRSLHIAEGDLGLAVQKAAKSADESTRREYYKAVESNKSDNRYKHVLLACANAIKNELGQFSASDVVLPYSAIMGRAMRIEHFARHLNAFCEPDRGPVLIKEGKKKAFRYRFANPLLQPLVAMMGSSRLSPAADDED